MPFCFAEKAIACRPQDVDKACQADSCLQSQTAVSTSQQDSQFTASSRHIDATYSPDSDSDIGVSE